MSSELAKGLLIASFVVVIVSVGFMMFSSPANVGTADLVIYVKCQSCGEMKSYRSEDFAVLARKQFDELKNSDPDLVDDIMYNISSALARDNAPVELMPAQSNAQVERRIIVLWGSKTKDIPMYCEKCGAYECFRAFKCRKCNEIFVIESPQDELTKTCSKCRGKP